MLLNESGQEGLILWPCSGPLTRFLQDYVQALFKGQFSFSLLPKSTVDNNPSPFPQSPNTTPAAFVP